MKMQQFIKAYFFLFFFIQIFDKLIMDGQVFEGQLRGVEDGRVDNDVRWKILELFILPTFAQWLID